MSHIHRIEDSCGGLVDIEYFCSDFCHQVWCDSNGQDYGGWDGCHDWPESVVMCASGCGHILSGVGVSS